MHLTIIGMMINSSPSPDYVFQLVTAILTGITVLLTGIYVSATLALVVITNKQSKNTLAASAKQSQDAIDAVHDQIIASEKQSQATIDAIHEQIEENKKQTLETIHIQHRPILVCTSCPVEDTLLNSLPLKIKNVGVGLAINIRVVLSYASTNAGETLQKGFILPSVLVPGEDEMISLNTPGLNNIPDTISEYSFFPDDSDTSYNQRLVITYQDIFNHKHLSIFDGRLSTNWKPYIIESNFKYGIDDICPDWTLLGKAQTEVTYLPSIWN